VSVVWVQENRRRVLCEVPWTGTVSVLSDGNVNFCCSSSAIVGNVNQNSFLEIWSGPVMQEIRRELADGHFPPQCRSSSCPLYRGDESFGWKPNRAPAPEPAQFQGSGLQDIDGSAGPVLELHYRGRPVRADLFVAFAGVKGEIRFLPNLEPYAVPFACDIELREDVPPLRFRILDQVDGAGVIPGAYLLSSALFEAGSNPNHLENCYWSETAPVSLGGVSASPRN
jgi:hypothetical protein